MLVAVFALMVAVAGGGQAIADTTVTIAKSISGSTIKKGSIKGDRLKSNTLTGKQIKESSLGVVPSATTAGNATTAGSATHANSSAELDGGTVVKTYNFKGTTGQAATVLERGGYKVVASCGAGNTPLLTVTNTGAGASEIIKNTLNQSGTPSTVTQFNFAQGTSEETIAITHGTGTFSAASTTGKTLEGTSFFDNNPSYGGAHAGCTVAGSLTSGA
jgi:hypothetical protein